jgi:undecaprenyl-diphosphatase
MSDQSLFLMINGWAGHYLPLDQFISGLANDYFLMVSICLCLVFIWFGTQDANRRSNLQRAIVLAMIATGLVNGLVAMSNHFFYRIRPFDALPEGSINLLFYTPSDSSFPSNFASVLFAIAFSILLADRRWGCILLGTAFLGGLCRIYVGIHYPLDIVGGLVFGALASAFAFGIGKLVDPFFKLVFKILKLIYLA